MWKYNSNMIEPRLPVCPDFSLSWKKKKKKEKQDPFISSTGNTSRNVRAKPECIMCGFRVGSVSVQCMWTSRWYLLGVERPGDHPDDPMSHRPGEPCSVRGEVHAPGLTPRPAHQGRRTPGLQLQDESRIGRWWRTETKHNKNSTTTSFAIQRHWQQAAVLWLSFPSLPREVWRYLSSPRCLATGRRDDNVTEEYYWNTNDLLYLSSALFSVEHIISFFTFSFLSSTPWVRPRRCPDVHLIKGRTRWTLGCSLCGERARQNVLSRFVPLATMLPEAVTFLFYVTPGRHNRAPSLNYSPCERVSCFPAEYLKHEWSVLSGDVIIKNNGQLRWLK